MRHMLLFVLLVMGAPFWLFARRRLGIRFFRVLALAAITIFAIAFVIDEKILPVPTPIEPFVQSRLATWFVSLTYLGGLLQVFVTLGARRLDNKRARAWSTGHFHLWHRWPVLTDLALVAWVMYLSYTGIFGPYGDPTTVTIAGISAAAYLSVACVGYLNQGILPFEPDPTRPAKSAPPPKPYLSSLQRMPRSAREDLGAIFSRRNPALRKITETDAG